MGIFLGGNKGATYIAGLAPEDAEEGGQFEVSWKYPVQI